LHDFWYEVKKRNLQKKKVSQVRKTWLRGEISDLYTSQRVSRMLISSMWCLSISYGDCSLMQKTRPRRFMIPLPYTLTDPFHLFYKLFLKKIVVLYENIEVTIAFFCRLRCLDAIQYQLSFLLKPTWKMRNVGKGCISS
jgi:hypothetical protein